MKELNQPGNRLAGTTGSDWIMRFIIFVRRLVYIFFSYRNLTPTSTSSSGFLICENENNEEVSVERLSGRRLIDVAYLFEQLSEIDHSPFNCSFKYFKFVGEIRHGFHSSFKFVCEMCNVNVVIKSDRSQHELNQHVVQGTVTSGNGFAQLDEFCAHVDIPCMSDKLFIKEQNVFCYYNKCRKSVNGKNKQHCRAV